MIANKTLFTYLIYLRWDLMIQRNNRPENAGGGSRRSHPGVLKNSYTKVLRKALETIGSKRLSLEHFQAFSLMRYGNHHRDFLWETFEGFIQLFYGTITDDCWRRKYYYAEKGCIKELKIFHILLQYHLLISSCCFENIDSTFPFEIDQVIFLLIILKHEMELLVVFVKFLSLQFSFSFQKQPPE